MFIFWTLISYSIIISSSVSSARQPWEGIINYLKIFSIGEYFVKFEGKGKDIWTYLEGFVQDHDCFVEFFDVGDDA